MKILYVLEYYAPYIGGAEKLFQNLAEQMAKNGHQVEVVTSRFDKKLLQNEVINGVLIRRVAVSNRFLFTFFSVPQVFKSAKYAQLIHTTTYNAAFPAWLVGKLRRKKVLISFHEVWGKLWFKLPFISPILKILFYLYEQFILHLPFNLFIAVSNATRKSLLEAGISEKKIIKIYNGISYAFYEKFIHKPPEKFVYTYFGRLGASKGLELLLEAVKIFSQQKPDSLLKLIIPQTPEAIFHKILEQIDKYKINANIQIISNLTRENLAYEITTSSCVVIPSRSEGFCFAAVETVALQVPVISSNQMALEEVVSGKYLKMNELTPAALVKSLAKAAKNEWETSPILRFELQKQVQEYVQMYQQFENK